MNPVDVAYAALSPVAKDVPVCAIFSVTTAEHIKWQRFHGLVFVLACEDAFEYKVAQEAGRKPYDRWKTMTQAAEFGKLELRDMDDIPVNWGFDFVHYRTPLRTTFATVAPVDLEKL